MNKYILLITSKGDLKPQYRKEGLSGHQQCQLYWSQCQQDPLYIDFFMTGSSQYVIQYICDLALSRICTALLANILQGIRNHKIPPDFTVQWQQRVFVFIALAWGAMCTV